VEITKENAQLIISKWVKDNKVVLFMKGTPHQPLCGYSNFVVELLKKYGIFLKM
jgi:monothiol glutaredoxin